MSGIEHVLEETRTFHPSPDFVESAHIKSREEYDEMYNRSIHEPDRFWGDQAEQFHWFKKWDTVLNKDAAPFYKWFEGGTTNVCYNCVDRHLPEHKDQVAFFWEGNDVGENSQMTYQQLHDEVVAVAKAQLARASPWNACQHSKSSRRIWLTRPAEMRNMRAVRLVVSPKANFSAIRRCRLGNVSSHAAKSIFVAAMSAGVDCRSSTTISRHSASLVS